MSVEGWVCDAARSFVVGTPDPEDLRLIDTTERALAAAIEARLGRAPDYVASPGTYDQKHIDRIGRVRNCVAYGPGILDLAHQPDDARARR